MSAQLEIGDYLKRHAIDVATKSAPEQWKLAASSYIRELAISGQEFTSEDVTAYVGQPTDNEGRAKPNAVGAIVNGAARRGLIERVGFTKAKRADRHSGMISIWRKKQ